MKKVLHDAYLKECVKGGKAPVQTHFVCQEDNENIYFHFDCEQNFAFPKHKEYNAPLYEGDIVEVLISLDSKNRYLEIEVNQYNAKYCVIIDNIDGNGDIIINKMDNCIFESRVLAQKERWITDIVLSKKNLAAIGWKKDNCFFNAHRQDFDQKGKLHLYSLYPTYSNSFHKTAAFEKLYKQED
ncbi:MAG TPA: hypothetical protein GXZ92_00800 [Clostridiales bacterium]|jgi:hypothetical protein|nr:hypothetical protein [Clostridiales bacterium]